MAISSLFLLLLLFILWVMQPEDKDKTVHKLADAINWNENLQDDTLKVFF